MAEVKNTSDPPAAAGSRSGGFELRLERGGVFVRLENQPIAPGVRLDVLTLQIPDVKFPFDVGQGAGQFRHRLADLVELSVALEPAAADAGLASAGLAAFGIEDLQLAVRDGFVEIAGRLSGGPPFTLEGGLLPAGDRDIALVFHSPRILGPAPVPAAALPHLARAVLDAIGPEALPTSPLAPLLRRILAPRGWKLPRANDVRLARAVVAGGAARIAWDRSAGATAASSGDADLLAADEGARTFRDAEALLARGDYGAAREAYLAAGAAATAHPFAAERLLSLLAHDERFHEEALDLAGDWLGRRPGFEPALLAEATVRLVRGEAARAAGALRALAAGASARGRSSLALAAAEAAFGVPGAPRADALPAVEIALQLRRDHVPALRALRAIARASGDREALLRASRRLVAYDPDPAVKARAHAELGELLLETDPSGARLNLDQALRLAPDDVDALEALGRACAAAGEPLRAVRALDRLRELLAARGERARAARAAVEAGALWEGPLAHAENALLRYRDAAELAPSADIHARAARAAEAAGQWAEAADQHAAALAALDPAADGAAALAVRTHLALADVAERRLRDPAGAAAHLAQAAALAPSDAALLRRLAPLERALGRPGDLLRTLDRLAPLEQDPAARAALLAEAGEAALAAGLGGDARARFTAAVAADPRCRSALLGAARLARERGDAVAERDALERLVPLAAPGEEAADVLDRLAGARDRAGDLSGALESATGARAAAPTLVRLEAALALARRAGDAAAVATLLADRARAAAAAGDAAAATDAWLERSRLVAATPAQALAALAEARALSPGHPAVLRAQADLGERTGDSRLTLGCLRALLAGAPDDAPALEVRAARAALDAGEAALAREHAERALERAVPGAAEVLDEILSRSGDDGARAQILARLGRHLEAARLLERHGDGAGACAALERAAADPATAPQALPRLAELRLAGGDRPGAGAALLALARLGEGRQAARLALQAFATGRDAAALDVAAEKDPTFAPALARRAALRAAADPGAALADAEAALRGDALADDERPGLLALAARAAAAGGDGAAARRHLAAYCDASPDDDGALARLAALHRAAGAADDLAAVLVRRLPLATGPDAAPVRLELSDLLAAHDPARAARLALDALERDPASAAALHALTTPPRSAHVGAAARAALLARLAAAPSASPTDAAAAHAARARLLAEGGDPAAALAAAREAARLAEEPDDLLELRARLAESTGDRADAARALLARAQRAEARLEAGAAERLAEAGLRAIAAGVPGGEGALRAALPLQLERDTARAVLEALVALARERGDAAAERETLPRLVPLLPTGARPAALLRVSILALEAKDAAAARASAEEARALAPRDLAPVEACRAAALAAGDLGAVADLLAVAAALDPASAGPRLLDRARLLAALGRTADADDAYGAALAALAPDRELADEHARFRRDALPSRSPAAPVEAFARRCPAPREAAVALRAAAALALAAGDHGRALRCARGAWSRTAAEPAFAGPLLARILYVMGGASEALVVHRILLDAGLAATAPDDAVALCRQAADLAESAGDRELALRALDELLRARPQELDAALLRFELDPDRARAPRALAEATLACGSRRRRALALATAADGALVGAQDPAFAEELFRRARAEAEGVPALGLELSRRRAAAVRRAEGTSSAAYLAALHETSAAAEAAGDAGEAMAVLEEAVQRERERGLFADAARDLLQIDALAAAQGDFAESGGRLRAAAAFLREAGDLDGATEVLRRAYGENPGSDETARRLEDLLRTRGAAVAGDLAALLADRVARAGPGADRAAALVRLAEVHAAGGDIVREEETLRAALRESPGHRSAEDRLLELLAASRRTGERARLLLERSARLPDGEERTALRREAARALAASADAENRELAAEAWRAIATSVPSDLEAARAAAGLLLGLGRREDAVPHLAALVQADPRDDAAGDELAKAYDDRPLEAAELALARAAAANGERRAARLHEAASAFFTFGDEDRASAALRAAFEAWPGDGAAFEEALRAATGELDAVDAVLSARARAVPGEAAACHRARGDALRAAGRGEDAVAAYEAARAADPDDAAVAVALAACLAETRGDVASAELDRTIVARAEASPGEIPDAAEAQARYRLGLALSFAGKGPAALPYLERALVLAPFDGHAGLGWAAVAQGHAELGDGASALAAARARVERANALGLHEERRAALEAEAELADRLGVPSALGPAQVELGAPASEHAAPEEPVAFEPPAGDEAEEPVAFEPPSGDAAPEEPVAFEADEDELAGAEEPVAFDEPPDDDDAALEQPVAFDEPPPDDDDAALEQPVAFDEPPLDEDAAAAEPPSPDTNAADEDPVARAAAWLASADALARSGAPAEDVRAALELACDADPDAALPWRERARLEGELGDPVAAARAHLAVSIRSERDDAAEAALEAARLFEDAGLHADAARALRAAVHARPDAVPAAVSGAAEALAAGDPASAARHLTGVDPAELPLPLRAGHVRKLALALAGAGRMEAARAALADAVAADPADAAARDALAALDARTDDWAATATALAGEAAQAVDAAEGAALYLRAATLLHERAGDAASAIAALRACVARSRASNVPAARATAEDALALLSVLGAPGPAAPRSSAAAPEAATPSPSFDSASPTATLRSGRTDLSSGRTEEEETPDPTLADLAAEAGAGPERAEALERLASERTAAGDHEDAVEALLGALDAGEEDVPAEEQPSERIAFDGDTAPEGGAAAPFAVETSDAPMDPAALAADGRERMEREDWQGAHDRLSLALAREPSDLTLARDLARVAEKLGLHDEYVQLGEVCADALAAYDPLAAASRYRHFAQVLRGQLGSPDRASAMLEKALALVPDDPDGRRELVALWTELPGGAPRALDAWLELARKDPADGEALAGVAQVCERIAAEVAEEDAARVRERARLAASLAAFVSPAAAPAPPGRMAVQIPAELRARVAAPGATGPLARLLEVLAPWLESLFPADLRRRGATAADRVEPDQVPALSAAFDGAARALGARPYTPYLVERPALEVAVENTQPPSILLSRSAAALDELALSFLAARTLDLVDHGWALAGKFAPKDVGILLELACIFAGGAPPSMGLPPERAGAFLAVLETQVPASAHAAARLLGAAASQELGETDPRALAAALRRTANRVALLYAGDPGAALRTLALLDRRLDGVPLDPAQALALPDLRDVALFALSDPFVELRAAVLG